MAGDRRIRLLNRAGRHRAAVAEYRVGERRDGARRMSVEPWAADSLAAVGRFADADRLLRAQLDDANNHRLDPAPVARLQVARLRVGIRAVWYEPERARRLRWQAGHWMESLPPQRGEAALEFAMLAGWLDGLIAEQAGDPRAALEHLARAAALSVRDGRLCARVRGALDRCVAHADPRAAWARRLAEIRIVDRPGVVQRWLADIIARPGGEALCRALSAALDQPLDGDEPGPAPGETPARTRARQALRRLSQMPDLALHQAVWQAALRRRLGDADGAAGALDALGAAGDPWTTVRRLSALELQPDLDRGDAEILMRWWGDPDGAVSMLARALVSRALRAAGDRSGSLDAARAAVRRIRRAEAAPLRWHLPSAWPGQHIALEALADAVTDGLDGAGPEADWCRRVKPRVEAALQTAGFLGAGGP